MSKQNHAPAFPHQPLQDKFGAVVMNFGLSKIEIMTMSIAAQLAAQHSEKYLPETIAEEAYSVAVAVMEKLSEEISKDMVAASQNKILTNGETATGQL